MTRRLFVFAAATALAIASEPALDRISSESLRASVSYLASDKLEGRATPSRGLDLAADFIAGQFRAEGLESATSDSSYFQVAKGPGRSTMRNVAAFLQGSDPVLRGQYVVLSAHYDHLGTNEKGIFRGANDNASGVASMIDIGGALARMEPHPKRSVLFLAFFGEEGGLLGSAYYVRHPLVPLKDTVVNVNLEQLGRTDTGSGREIGAFAITGPSYSNLADIFRAAAATEGVNLYAKKNADDYFNLSDNYSFAAAGVVDTTAVVAFEFPGYHQPADKADKIDFPNMAKVTRGIAAAVIRLADEPDVPQWSGTPAAKAFRDRAVKGK